MTTIGQIVSRLRDSIKEQADDSIYSDRYLWSSFFTIAKQLVKQDADTGRIYSMSNLWAPICIQMEPVSSIMCDCFAIPHDCTVYRSKLKLPNFLESSDGFIYRWIATPDNSKQFVFVSPYQFQVKTKIKYNREKYTFLHNGYLYTPTETYPILNISALFYGDLKPFLCNDISQVSDQCASKLQEQIILPDYLENAAIKMAIAELIPTVQLPSDQNPNANPDQKQISL